MPSLQALEEFKFSFQSIGDERQTLAALNLPQDDLPLPGKDPADAFGQSPSDDLAQPLGADFDSPLDVQAEDGGDEAEGGIFGDLSDLLGGMDVTADADTAAYAGADMVSGGQEDAAFGDFLDSLQDNITDDAEAADSDMGDIDLADFGISEAGDDDAEAADSDMGDIDLADFGISDSGDDDAEAADTDMGDIDLADFGMAESADDAADMDMSALLDGFADEIEAERAGGESELPSLDDDMSAFDSDEPTESADFAMPEDEFSGFGMAESADEGIDALSDDTALFSEPTEALSPSNDFGEIDFGNLPDFDSGDTLDLAAEGGFSRGADTDMDADTSALSSSDDEDDFNFAGADFETDNNELLEELSGDPFDSFTMDDSNIAGGLDAAAGGTDDLGGDFSLDNINSVFQGASAPASIAAAAAAMTEGAAKAKSKKSDDVDDIEEIMLTQEELDSLHETLSSYPLNLRIACQELIAEHAVDPEKMSRLVKMLVTGAAAKEAASLSSKLLDRTIHIPKGYEKKTGEELEAEQSSFRYIFVHNFLPVFRIFLVIAIIGMSLFYLGWRFIYTPIQANRIYRHGLELIAIGEFTAANHRFNEAFAMHQRARWFFEYARAFTEARQFTLAEEKYLQLLHFTASRNRRGIPDRTAVLEYANMVSTVMGHHERADAILRHNLLDFFPDDRDGLLALGDNALAWGEYDPTRFENAREAYARIIEQVGRTDLMLERMLLYFIRTDDLGEALQLQAHFMASDRTQISADTLAELGGYLLDKRLEEVRGVPNQFLEHIGGIRDVLLRAIRQNPLLPEGYYHLARYYNYFNNPFDERQVLEIALQVFDLAPEGSPSRIRYHVNALRRYGEMLIGTREFFRAEEYLTRGIGIFNNALERNLLAPAPEFGRLFAHLGDLELFVRDGNMQAALQYYRIAEHNGWAPPEIQYRMGVAYYHLQQWGYALERFLAAHRGTTHLNRRILYALGNASFLRGNYFAAQGFYEQLLGILYTDRDRMPPIMPTDNAWQLDLVERIMVAQNNLGVTLEALTERTGDHNFRARAQGLYADSARAWDILTRDPETMIRMRPSPDIYAPGVSPAFLNIRNNLNPLPGHQPLFFMRIDMDMFEFSQWEMIAPPGYMLSAGVGLAR